MVESVQVDFAVTSFTGPEPLAVSDLRNTSGSGSWLRVDFADDDTLLTGLITEARMLAEQITGKSFAPQTIQAEYTLPQIPLNTLSGAALAFDNNFYQYNESLGANPFSPAPWELKIPMPPLVGVSLFEYRLTVFTPWVTWPALASDGVTPNYVVDTVKMPGVVYIQYPPPAYQYRLTCTVGYTTLPADLKLKLIKVIAWMYDNREEPLPHGLVQELVARKSWVL